MIPGFNEASAIGPPVADLIPLIVLIGLVSEQVSSLRVEGRRQ